MACNCGGRRGVGAAALASGRGVAIVYRVTFANGATVDSWDEPTAQKRVAVNEGASYQKVDARTGLPVA